MISFDPTDNLYGWIVPSQLAAVNQGIISAMTYFFFFVPIKRFIAILFQTIMIYGMHAVAEGMSAISHYFGGSRAGGWFSI